MKRLLSLIALAVFLFLSFCAGLAQRDESSFQAHTNEAHLMMASRASPSAASTKMMSSEAVPQAKQKMMAVEESDESMGQEFAQHLQESLGNVQDSTSNVLSQPMLVRTGRMVAQVPLDEKKVFQSKLESIVQQDANGYFQDQNLRNEHSFSYGVESAGSFHATIRVPSDKFEDTLAEITSLVGSVISLNTNTRDVSEEYVDSSARANVLEASRASLQTLMAKANSVKDVLQLQNELNRLTEQIESHRQRIKHLQKQSSYSTLYLEVAFSVPPTTKVVDAWNPIKSVYAALRDTQEFMQVMIDGIVYLSVCLFPILIVVALAWGRTKRPNSTVDQVNTKV